MQQASVAVSSAPLPYLPPTAEELIDRELRKLDLQDSLIEFAKDAWHLIEPGAPLSEATVRMHVTRGRKARGSATASRS